MKKIEVIKNNNSFIFNKDYIDHYISKPDKIYLRVLFKKIYGFYIKRI